MKTNKENQSLDKQVIERDASNSKKTRQDPRCMMELSLKMPRGSARDIFHGL
jgi:hypothetical protein